MTENSLRRGNGIHSGTAGNYDRASQKGGKRVRDVPVYKGGVGDHPSELMAKHEMQERRERVQRYNGRSGRRGGTCSK